MRKPSSSMKSGGKYSILEVNLKNNNSLKVIEIKEFFNDIIVNICVCICI